MVSFHGLLSLSDLGSDSQLNPVYWNHIMGQMGQIIMRDNNEI